MKKDNAWLDEMMDAALSDPSPKQPDFAEIRAWALEDTRTSSRRRFRRPAAVAALAAAATLLVAIPLAYTIGRESARRQAVKEDAEMFVEELIGETLFEDGLSSVEEGSDSLLLMGDLFDT